MLKFKFLSYFEFMQTICTNFFHKQIFHSSSENFTIPKLLLEFIFSFSVTGYWFNNICLHQIGKKFLSTWTFQLKKFHNCTSSKHLIKAKLFKKSMDMNRRFYREIAAFLRKYTFNIHFPILNVHFFFIQKSTYMKISIMKFIFLVQK